MGLESFVVKFRFKFISRLDQRSCPTRLDQRSRHNTYNMIYHNQNKFIIDRQSVRENCSLFILFEQRGKILISINQDVFNKVELSYNDFANICNKV